MAMAHAPWTACLAVLCIAATTTGCREQEQNRPLSFQPHIYQGEKLPPLTEQQQRELRERGGLQR
jgi:hypothetical protein